MSKRSRWIFWIGVFALTGCIGTDVIDGPFEDPTIAITPAATAVALQGAVTFDAEYIDDLGEVVEATLVWSSSSTVVTIDAAGTATGVSIGQAMIVASIPELGLQSDPALINVVASADGIAIVRIEPGGAGLLVGETVQLTAEALRLDMTPAVADFAWQSSDPTVATVSADGVVTAVASGEARITAIAEGIQSAPATFRVVEPDEGRSGVLSGLSSYTVRGTFTLSAGDDGNLKLTLQEDFSSSQGPALEVLLSPTSRNGPDSISLGTLQSTSGSQEYVVPEGVELMDFDWVLIHCIPFNVTFGRGEFQ